MLWNFFFSLNILLIYSFWGPKQLDLFQLEELNNAQGNTAGKIDLKGKNGKPSKEVPDDPIDIQRREKVKEAMLHAWGSYEKYAWGQDELQVWWISIQSTFYFSFDDSFNSVFPCGLLLLLWGYNFSLFPSRVNLVELATSGFNSLIFLLWYKHTQWFCDSCKNIKEIMHWSH